MGRYAQARRRGGGAPTPLPDGPLTLLSVTASNSNTFILKFSGPVTTDPGVSFDGAFVIGADPLSGITQTDAVTVAANTSDPHFGGDPWDLTAQPNWLLDTVVNPDSGTVLT